jgi:hypothetical protein
VILVMPHEEMLRSVDGMRCDPVRRRSDPTPASRA